MGKAKRQKGRDRLAAKNVTLAGKTLCHDGRCLEEVFDEPFSTCQGCKLLFCGNHLFRIFSKKTKKQMNLPRVLKPGELAGPADDFFCNRCGDKLQAKE